jgi:hypothetical protein
MAERKLPESAAKTLSRRSLLEWLGKGVVLSLGGATLASCLGGGHEPDAGLDGFDLPDGGGSGEGGGDQAPGDFPFEPGGLDQEVFSGWGERTVDRQDLASILASWQLSVTGMVDEPKVFTFADLVGLQRTDMLVDFHCVEGWSIYDVPWNGVHLAQIFERVGVRPQATHVTFRTIGDRYNENLPIQVALEPKTILGYGIGGNTLPLKHGFPLRVVIPRLLGYKNAKYVYGIELTDHPVEGFWVAAGYPYDGEVDPSRLRPGKY